TPRVQIITRKGYGGAYVVMNSKSIGADIAFAWPSAEIAVMGADGAVNIIFRKDIESAPDVESRRAELILEYEDRFLNPYQAAERGYVDDVIDPRDTRRMLVRALDMLRTKREQLPSRKHGNSPLCGATRGTARAGAPSGSRWASEAGGSEPNEGRSGGRQP